MRPSPSHEDKFNIRSIILIYSLYIESAFNGWWWDSIFIFTGSGKKGAQFPGADTLSKFMWTPFHNSVEGESVGMAT